MGTVASSGSGADLHCEKVKVSNTSNTTNTDDIGAFRPAEMSLEEDEGAGMPTCTNVCPVLGFELDFKDPSGLSFEAATILYPCRHVCSRLAVFMVRPCSRIGTRKCSHACLTQIS